MFAHRTRVQYINGRKGRIVDCRVLNFQNSYKIVWNKPNGKERRWQDEVPYGEIFSSDDYFGFEFSWVPEASLLSLFS